jgi:DNA-binding CsgD family transcriptional regulator
VEAEASDREAERRALERAVAAVPGEDLAASLGEVVDRLPLAVSVEAVSLRVRELDGERLYLLAAVGMPFRDVRRLALEHFPIPQARSVLAVGPEHSFAHALGLVWLHGQWLVADDEPLGLLIVSTRTARRPDESDLRVLQDASRRLAERLQQTDRSPRALHAASLALVRRLVQWTPASEDGLLHNLRPRERAVLELYADGLSAGEIAQLLVISPHTVRTHLKLAFRRLGVHSRDEVTEIVRRDQLLTLL